MKRRKAYILAIGIALCTYTKVYAKETIPPSLFPQTVGMTGKVTSEQVNIRNHPDINAAIIEKVSEQPIQIVGKNDEWYKVTINGEEGWIYSQYVEVARRDLIPYAKVKGEEIVEYGMQFIGTPYVWGGTNLQGGVDCSGFTQQVFKAFDVEISRVSYMQAKDGPEVGVSQLRTGDLIFFDTTGVNNGRISHVGIYVGDGKFIHSESSRGVTVSNLASPYYDRNFVKAIRVLS
nr:NlpC/P60 family protein [uncultured Niameybacter sp.]